MEGAAFTGIIPWFLDSLPQIIAARVALGIPAEMRGRGTGMWTGAFFLGQFVAPIVAAASVGVTQGLGNTLLLYAVLVAIGAIATFTFAGKKQAS